MAELFNANVAKVSNDTSTSSAIRWERIRCNSIRDKVDECLNASPHGEILGKVDSSRFRKSEITKCCIRDENGRLRRAVDAIIAGCVQVVAGI
jgi:hypothetical protein